jgi:uncharacterized radical SAM superfamily protein
MATLATLAKHNPEDYDAVLLSGGSNTAGAVDFSSHIDTILGLPQHLKLNIHPGFQPAANFSALQSRSLIFSFDIPGSDEVIRNVFRLPYCVDDFRRLYIEYAQRFITIPHITIGLNHGRESGETDTLDFLQHHQPHELVFIVFRPTPGTNGQSATATGRAGCQSRERSTTAIYLPDHAWLHATGR